MIYWDMNRIVNTIPTAKITAAGIPISYSQAGNGPPLLLVHGFPLDHAMWNEQVDEFAATHQVIAPDLRGFGGTPLSAGEVDTDSVAVSMRQFADDLAALLDALQVTEPVVLCGLSMGGYIAWQFAQHHRDRLAALICCDTRARADTAEVAANRLDVAQRVLVSGSELLAGAMSMKLVADGTASSHPEIVAQVREMILRAPPAGIAAAQRGMAARPDMTDLLSGFDLPTLLVVGESDEISPPEEMREIAAAMPLATLVEVADAGHMSPLEQPAAVNSAIVEFLATLADEDVP